MSLYEGTSDGTFLEMTKIGWLILSARHIRGVTGYHFEAPTVEVDPDLEVLGAPEVTGGLLHPLDDGVRGGKGHILLFAHPQ